MLPTPPSDFEKYLYLGQNKTILYSFGLFSLAALVAGMVLFSVQHPSVYIYGFFALMTAAYLGISYCIGIFGKTFDFEKHKKILGNKNPTSVDVFLPCCGEDISIIENTYKAVSKLDWEELNVYVLDDKGDSRISDLASRYGFNYISRPNKGELKKAGNMRYAFPLTSGELILILDADFAPRPDMLKELAPYFKYDEKIGIVQSPQYFEILPEHSWVQKGAAYVQELFYRLIQVNRNSWGAPICVGTNALYRRSALEPFGGTAPIGYSEDLHTGIMLMENGWKVTYVPINLAKGVCPDTANAFMTQQYRWAMGSTTLLLSSKYWKMKMSLMARLSFLSGQAYYVATALGIFITPIPALLVVWFKPDQVFWYNCLFSVPSFIYGSFYMAIWSKAPFGMYALRSRLIAYYAHLFAIKDKLMNTAMPWVPTGAATKTSSRFDSFRHLLFWWTSVIYTMTICGAFYRMESLLAYDFYPMIFFTGFNYWLNMSILRDQ